ncbi:MAG TPA: VOC family protein [Candidatus Dormibacteraeota bacterium]|nr:VOC family protein [Candidatus Dormibacteraeota bacterium]
MLKIRRVGTAIPAQDVRRARQFYEQKLGLKPTQETPDGGAMYVIGETGFFVFPSMGKASGDHTQMAVDVEDVEEAARELKKSGVKLEEYDTPDFKTRDGIAELPDGSKGAWFKDTEGNLIALGTMAPVGARSS